MMKLWGWIKIKGYIRYHIQSIIDHKLLFISLILLAVMFLTNLLIFLSLKSQVYYLDQYNTYWTYSLNILSFSGVSLASFMFVESFSSSKDMARYIIIPLDGQSESDNIVYILTRVGVIIGFLGLFYCLSWGELLIFIAGLHIKYITLEWLWASLEGFLLSLIYGLIALWGYALFKHKLSLVAAILLFTIRYMLSDYLYIVKLGSLDQGLNRYDIIYGCLWLILALWQEMHNEKNW